MTDTIKDFLVSIGYEHDEESRKRFLDTLSDVSKRVIEFGVGLKLAAEGWDQTFTKTAEGIERLYWVARRTSTSIGELEALRYAASNIGSTADEMQGAIESFSKAMRLNAGVRGMVESYIGSTKGISDAEAFLRFFEATSKETYEIQAQRFQMFGVPESLLFAMRQAGPEMRRQMLEAYEKIRKAGGAGSGEGAKAFLEAWRGLQFTLRLLQWKWADELGHSFSGQLNKFAEWLDQHSEQISRGLQIIAQAIIDLAWALINLVATAPEWKPVLDDIAKTLRDWLVSIDHAVQSTIGWRVALEALVVLLVSHQLRRAIGQLAALTAAFVAFLAIFGLRPAQAQGGGATPAGAAPGGVAGQNLEGGRGIGGSTGPGVGSGGGGGGGRVTPAQEPKGIRGRVGGVFSRVRHAIRRGRGLDVSATPGSAEGLRGLIEREAKAAGVDPRIMFGIYAGEGERGYVGDRGSSFGPFQLHYGNVAGGGMRVGGLGDEFTRETGLDARDRKTIPAQVRWVAQWIAKHGTVTPWHGYRGNRDWNPRWSGGGYVPPTETPKAPAPGPGPSPPPVAPARTPFGDLSGTHFPLSGVTAQNYSLDAGPPPGDSTWGRTITHTQGERRLQIDVNGVSDPESVAKHINTHIKEDHSDMVKSTGGAKLDAAAQHAGGAKLGAADIHRSLDTKVGHIQSGMMHEHSKLTH